MPKSLDEVRRTHPHIGLAVYCFDPGGVATLELYAPDGEIYAFKAPTVAEAIAIAFPEPAQDAALEAGTKRVLPQFMTRKEMPQRTLPPAPAAAPANIFAEPTPPPSIFD